MEKKIIYRQLKQNKFENCLNLISKFKKNTHLNRKFIEWDYFLNPFGEAKIFVAEYNNEFIGITFCIPLKFQNNKKIYNGFRTQDVLTDVNFRRMGVFTNLLRLSNKYLDQNSDINITFPNENSLIFFEKNNWQEICKIPLISKTINNKNNFKLQYSLINKFTNIHEDIWRENINDKIDIMWTKEYSNWRYTLNPRFDYKIFEIKDCEKKIGYIVLKKHEQKNDLSIGHICQLVCPDRYMKDSINFAANYFFDLSIKKLTMWRINCNDLFSKELGFTKVFLEKKKFMYKSKTIYDKSSLNLSMSYCDIY